MGVEEHFGFINDQHQESDDEQSDEKTIDQGITNDPHFGRSETIIEEDKQRQAEADKQKRRPGYDGTLPHSGYYPEAQADVLREEAAGGKDPHLDSRAADIIEFGVSGENKTLWEKMSDAGKAVFEGLLNIPGMNSLTAKLGMKYEQFWLEKTNKKTQELGRQVQGLDVLIGLKEKIIADMESKEEKNFIKKEIGKLKLQSCINEVDRFKDEKDKLMAKIGIYEADARFYAQERDKVADWLIGYYSEKLSKPVAELEAANAALNNFDIENEPVEKEFAKIEDEIAKLEKQKNEAVKALAATGMVPKKIDKEIAYFDEEMKGLRAELGKRYGLRRRRARIEQEIAKTNEKLIRMDKRPEFINAKNSKALILTPQTSDAAEGATDTGSVAEPEASPPENNPAENVENPTYPMKDVVGAWNKFIKEKINQGFKFHIDKSIDLDVLAQKTQGGEQIDIGKFQQITRSFYEAEYSQAPFLKQTINRFLDEFVKNSIFFVEAYGNRENNQRPSATANQVTQTNRDSAPESVERGNEVDKEPQESDELAENSGENQKFQVGEFADRWKEFVIKYFGSRRGEALTIRPNELEGAEFVPADGFVDIKGFVAIIEQFYQKNFNIGNKAKKELEQAIASFLKESGKSIT
jgi:hypothetical protein